MQRSISQHKRKMFVEQLRANASEAESNLELLDGENCSTHSYMSTVSYRSQKRIVYRRGSDRIIRVLWYYSPYYLKVPVTNIRTFALEMTIISHTQAYNNEVLYFLHP